MLRPARAGRHRQAPALPV
uniref:Uncharacterized protein n=1 Tax=Arundo donax TaxID=35708 RepID=A0A0A9BC49_ARUDO